MKYPQLVPMPSAVQDWLDEQLEARGIDAVVYTRYILSLLQRDTLDLLDDPLSLSPSKEKKFGIEKLVDELCAKLKEIQSEGEKSVHLELSQPPHSNKKLQSPSPQDQIKKYYEAFPPLSSKPSKADNQSVVPEIPEATSVWGGKKETEGSDTRAGSRPWAGRGNMKLRSQGSWEKESYGFAWNMAEERMLGPEEAGCEPLRVLRCNRQNRGGDAGLLACRRLYERQAGCPERSADDGKLAQLIAKFDRNIEALWSAEDVEEGEEQELPVDLNELLSSPGGERSPVEAQCPNRSDPAGQAGNSFIHSGTNITNSIWSDNPSQDGSVEHESFVVDAAAQPLGIQEVVDDAAEVNVSVDHSDIKVGSPTNTVSGDYGKNTFQSENVDGYRSLHRQKEIFLNQHYDSLELGSIFNFAPKEDAAASRNRFENFPPVFNNMSWGLNYPLREVTRGIAVQVLAETDDDSERGGYANGLGHISRPVGQPSAPHGSLTALNHHGEGSSFSVVVPRQEPASALRASEAAADQSVPTGAEDVAANPEGAAEEEDLLTSSRTHFRPIRQDSSESRGGNVGHYADGTTFVIPNNLENVSFKRSDSGTLYLEAEAGVGSPRKYMEYKEKEPYGGRYRIYVLEAVDDGSDFVPKFQVCQNEKCCQTEVEDEEESLVMSDEEVDPKRSRQTISTVDETEEFFFPGDEHLVAKLINDIDNDDCGEANSSDCSSCNLNGGDGTEALDIRPDVDRKGSDEWSNNIKICFKCNNNNNILAWRNGWLDSDEGKMELWNNSTTEIPSWPDIWSDCADVAAGKAACERCVLAGEGAGSVQRRRLREELSRDGEQLLSDLSYFQHLYLGSDWPEDGAPPAAPQKVTCLSSADQSPQEISLYAEDRGSVPTPNQTPAGRGKCVAGCILGRLPGATQPPREAGCKHNERPFSISVISKDRKRRHSASQRACALPWDVSCRAVLVADAACLEGVACPLRASSAGGHALRPVTL
ncbi:uncharacterized protein LOC134536133 isoform X2 [Bacillus rossius redtenbacheri]|uniref:uncharacterized protein LOC134536133 isoform X2 n=1 Tax=Bacillus rossius redtenbacheri TaxID=93214 RepID=UPI002FDE65C4